MKKFFFKLICLLPVLIGVGVVNFLGDPAHLFHSPTQEAYEYEEQIADFLIHGKNVTQISNFNERMFQKLYIENQPKKKDMVVIGSSRSMAIRSSFFPGKTFFNNSVSGAMLQDYFSLYDLYRRQGQLPKEIVLGIDPWIFNKNYPEDRWKMLEAYYDELSNVISAPSGQFNYKIRDFIPENLLELFSLSYFRAASHKLLSKESGVEADTSDDEPVSVNTSVNEGQTILADGSRVYDKITREKSKDEIDAIAISFATQSTSYGFDSFFELDKKTQKNLEQFISLVKKDGVKITLFLPPYHYKSYEIMSKLPKYKMMKEVEAYLIRFCRENKISLVGSYNPQKLPIHEDDFLDGMHFKDTAVRKIFKSIYFRGSDL